MHLVGYCIAGPTWHLYGSWRHPGSDAVDALDPARYENIARTLEAGKFDGLFFVDVLTLFDSFAGGFRTNLKEAGQIFLMEPVQLLATMARVTSRIGLAATMSTTFYPPFHIARTFATLDHVSRGRAGWNVVTSANDREAQNFGLDRLMDRNDRYDHADEVLEACDALWGSWDPDALILDREGNRWADPDKVRYVDYEGRWIKTRGPLTTPSSPQGRPVIMQAGSSPRGRAFAGRWAEMIFTLQHAKADMQAFYQDIKARVVANGRPEHHCAVLPSIDVVLGETRSIARERQDYINSFASPTLGLAEISNAIGVDLSGFPLDQPIAQMEITQGAQGIFDIFLQGSKAENLTLADAGRAWAINQMTPQIVGTAKDVADHLEDLFASRCCDGFMLCPSLTPAGYVDFVTTVVPELQRRGLFRREYTQTTFRGHLQG